MNSFLSRSSRRLLCAGLLLAAAAAAVPAQDWPKQPVRILVGSSPGGGTDAMARAVADKLGPALKITVVVENKPGASNTLAADDEPVVTLLRGLELRDTRSRSLRRAVSVFAAGFALYSFAVAQLLWAGR